MIEVHKPLPRQVGGAVLAPTLTLAAWRLRATWRMLLVTGLGMLAAVVLICTVPLYTQVALTAGLRGVLTATPQAAELDLHASARTITTSSLAQETQEFLQIMHQEAGAYLTGASEFFLQMTPLPAKGFDPASPIVLTGTSMSQAATHVTLAQGRLPQDGSDALELALTPETATTLGLKIGDTLTLLFDIPTLSGVVTEPLAFQVVGLFHAHQGDPFWHGNTFAPIELSEFTDYQALMASAPFAATLTRLANKDQKNGGIGLPELASLNWYYHLNPSQIDSTQLDDLIARLAATQNQLAEVGATREASYLATLQLLGPAVAAFESSSTLERFRDRVAVVRIPVVILALQMGGLVLFFASLMAELLVEQQTEAIAVLRSRGASRRQVLGSLAFQSAGLAALALVFGPLLALGGAWALARVILSPAEQGAQNVLARNLLPLLLGVGWEALAATLCASLVVMLAVRGASKHSLLDVRRDAAREGQRPLWQRWYLDVVIAVLALLGYGVSLYVTQAGVADARVDLLISTPLTLIAPLLLGLAGLLCFLRFFSPLITRLTWVAQQRSAAAPVLALAQLARAPRRALRLVLLLGLTSSFAIFSLTFTATEPQQLANVAAYQVGADFSGRLIASATPPLLAEQEAAYRALPGVLAASAGYATDVSIQDNPVALLAVDSRTFAQTALWTGQDSSQPLATLMAQLTSEHALASGKVPAIVDELAWERMHLVLGAQVLLPVGGEGATVPLIVVARIDHLPTVNDSLVTAGTSDYTPPGGLLLDFQTLAGRASSLGQSLTPNTIWLRTRDDAAALAGIRTALSNGPLQLENLQDRRLMLAQFLADPLYLTLKGVLALGALATLVLALAGTLFASWVHARRRLTTFAVLRALGMEPREIARVFAWEQGLIYAGALAVGLIFGALLVVTMVPALAFVGAPSYGSALSSGEFYVLQHVLPTQIVLPLSLLLIFGVLVALGGCALWMMAWMVSRPALAQTLRLNAD